MDASFPINQVLLGDCIAVMNDLPEQCVDLIFADPPYNLQLNGELWRPDMTRVDAVRDGWDQFLSFAEYDAFTRAWLTAARRILKGTGTLWVIGSYHNIFRVGSALLDLGYWILNDVVWIKNNPLPQMRGVRFCNAHETLIWAKKSRAQTRYTFHYRDMKAGNEDRQMRSDWYLPICSGGERETVDGHKAHSTQKPEALLHRIIAATSDPGDLVFDPFCGSGVTAAVARKLGRRFLTVDREEEYVQMARRRVAEIPFASPPEEGVSIDAPKPRISFASLVESGKLSAGDRLWLHRSEVIATIQANGTVMAQGVRGSIHKVAAACLGLPACNGWTHWSYWDREQQQYRLIDALRPGQTEPKRS